MDASSDTTTASDSRKESPIHKKVMSIHKDLILVRTIALIIAILLVIGLIPTISMALEEDVDDQQADTELLAHIDEDLGALPPTTDSTPATSGSTPLATGSTPATSGSTPAMSDSTPLATTRLIDISTITPGDRGPGWNFNINNILIIENGADVEITGTVNDGRYIEVSGNATITLNKLQILVEASGLYYHPAIYLYRGVNVHLTLVDINNLNGIGNRRSAGIYTEGATLTIDGTGTLNARGADYWPGIGGNPNGTVIINGGTVNAQGGLRAAGIGGAETSQGGTIIINGGIVTATGGSEGAGIGGGYKYPGGETTINGGSVTAIGGNDGTGIGGSNFGGAGNILITGGTVKAVAGANAAFMGGGRDASGGSITLSGGTITTDGPGSGIGIGAGSSTTPVTITGGSIRLSAGSINAPTDGSRPVYLNTLVLGSTVQAHTAVTAGAIEDTSYGLTDVMTDGEAKVYLWLPSTNDHARINLTANGNNYASDYTRTANNGNSAKLVRSIALINAIQVGGAPKTTDSNGIQLTFDTAVSGLSEKDIKLSGDVDVIKGSLAGSGTEWTLGISAPSAAGTITLSVSDFSEYTLSAGATQDIAVYKDIRTVSAVGTQDTSFTYGAAGNVSYSISTTDFTDGSYAVILHDAPAGVTVTNNSRLTINASRATLILDVAADVPARAHTGMSFSIEGKTSPSFSLTVDRKDIADAQITFEAAPYTYTGSALTPDACVEIDGVTLTVSTDYETISDRDYTNNINAGNNTAVLTISGKGNYSGRADGSFTIEPKDATESDLSYLIPEGHRYTASPQGIGDVTTASPKTGMGAITVFYVGTDSTLYPSSTTPPTNAGTYLVTADIAEGTNYHAGSGLVLGTYTIDMIAPVVSWPSGLVLTYGNTLDSLLPLSATSGTPGSFSWAEGDRQPAVSDSLTTGYTLHFTPDDSVNYRADSTSDMRLTIGKAEQATPSAPSLAHKTDTNVTLATRAECEYAMSTGDFLPLGPWQSSATFSDLKPETSYYFFMRQKEDANHKASAASIALPVTTEKARPVDMGVAGNESGTGGGSSGSSGSSGEGSGTDDGGNGSSRSADNGGGDGGGSTAALPPTTASQIPTQDKALDPAESSPDSMPVPRQPITVGNDAAPRAHDGTLVGMAPGIFSPEIWWPSSLLIVMLLSLVLLTQAIRLISRRLAPQEPVKQTPENE